MSLDFFKGVNNLNQRRTYERSDSGRDFSRGPASPSSSSRSRSIQGRRDANENIQVHRQQDHVGGGHGAWANHNPMVSIPERLPRGHAYPYHQDYRQHQAIPNEHTRPFNQPTTNYNIPNGPFIHAPPFSYNEPPTRTSAHIHSCPSCEHRVMVQVAHFHSCPSCEIPIMVQVTADLSYHQVTSIPAATARTNKMAVRKSKPTLPSHGAQKYSPDPDSETSDDDSLSNDSLSNDMVEVDAFEKQPERVTVPREEVQPLLPVETKLRRSYASITAGNTIVTKNDDKPSEEEANEDKRSEKEAKDNNKTASQVEEADDINGFTTVVSSKSKKKAKAEAKAAAIMESRKMYNKQRRWPQRDEHDKQHHRNDWGARREHNEGPRDGYDKHHGRVARDIGHDTHRGSPRDGHNKTPRA